MAQYKFTKSTDVEHEITLDSILLRAVWDSRVAYAGRTAPLTVETFAVGEGASIKIALVNRKGKKLDNLDGEIFGNRFKGELRVPEDLSIHETIAFSVELPKNSLSGQSDFIPVRRPPELVSIGWSASEARRGEVVTLSAKLKHAINRSQATLTLYEYDEDGAHDRIVELQAEVVDGEIRCDWEYEYHEDTDEIPTKEERERYGGDYNPPEYFFTVTVGDDVLGEEQESGLLLFKDWVDIQVVDQAGIGLSGQKYTLTLPDGSTRSGELDEEGCAREDDIPPGKVKLELPDCDGRAM